MWGMKRWVECEGYGKRIARGRLHKSGVHCGSALKN